MRAKFDLALYLLIASVLLGFSFYVSTPKPDKKSETDITWFDLGKNQIEELSFSRGATSVVITKGVDLQRFRILVKTASEKPEEIESGAVPVSKKFDQLVESLKPLYAERKLGFAKDLNLKEFGFDEDPGVLSIKYGSEGQLNLKIGKKAYGGSSRFVLDESQSQVILVDSKMFYFLENASVELVEKLLFSEDETYSKVEFDFPSGVVKSAYPFGKKGAGDWSSSESATKKDEKISNFISRLLKVRVDRYATRLESEKLASEKSLISFRTFVNQQKQDDVLVFKTIEDPSKGPSYFVKSSVLGTMARIQTMVGEKLEKDFSEIFKD